MLVTESMGRRGLRGFKVFREKPDCKVPKDLKGFKVYKASKDRRVYRAIRVLRARMEQMERTDLRVSLILPQNLSA